MLDMQGVVKRYGTFTAVAGLDLTVAAGQIHGFLGPNGAGKTTTMKMIGGLVRPTAGRIIVDGIDLAVDPLAVKARLGYVPDRPHVYERLSALEYLYFIAGLYRLDRKTAIEDSHRLLALFGLGDRIDHLIESFSHGMKQRLVMASVLLHRPKLLIVDEPMVGLDPRGARLLKDVLRQESHEQKLAVLLSTHTLEVADELCDVVTVIHRGRLVARGTPAELRAEAGEERLEAVFLQLTEEAEEASQAARFE